jgi:hypothetical protein
VFRRTWTPSRAAATAAIPLPGVGAIAIDAGTVPRIIQTRAARAGFDPALLGGHSLKRRALPPASVHSIPPGRQQVASTAQDALHRAGRPKWPARALICALYRDEIAPSRTKNTPSHNPSPRVPRSGDPKPGGRLGA